MSDDYPDRDTNRCLDCEALLMHSPQTYVARVQGVGQVLVDMWPDGKVTVATRSASWETWSAPVTADRRN